MGTIKKTRGSKRRAALRRTILERESQPDILYFPDGAMSRKRILAMPNAKEYIHALLNDEKMGTCENEE